MATLVTFHAHPDDACLGTGGAMRKAFEEGHRVVLVVATRGENSAIADGFPPPGEELWKVRVAEAAEAAEILGASRVEFLGYVDSGEAGQPTNTAPGSFWTADVDEAADKLAAILREEEADVLTIYDDNGGYGHPDHIAVYRVGTRAAELAGTPRVYQQTGNRDEIRRSLAQDGSPLPDIDFGKPEEELTCKVDVTPYVDAKRRAMQAHASLAPEGSLLANFLAMPDEVFRFAFGTEWYIREGQGPGITETDLMAGLPAAGQARGAA